ncbi:hypothetical protein [Nostoc sp.]
MFQLLSLKVMYPSPDKDGAACLILWGYRKAKPSIHGSSPKSGNP